MNDDVIIPVLRKAVMGVLMTTAGEDLGFTPLPGSLAQYKVTWLQGFNVLFEKFHFQCGVSLQ